MTTPWKYTIPISRVEMRADGPYLIGEASGPERDTHGTEMDPAAILGFARQIQDAADNGQPIPYIDHHMKVGVMRELGHLAEAAITPDYHLKVGVRLDEENPAAMYHYKQVQRGKQYGMSIKGDGVDYVIGRDAESGQRVIRFTNVKLNEISATTAPSWVPSFGTVLARSVDGLEEDEGDQAMSDPITVARTETPASSEAAPEIETPAVEPTPERQEEAAAVETAPVTAPVETPAPEVQGTEVETPVGDDAEVERARTAKAERETFASMLVALVEQAKRFGIDIAPAEESAPIETPAPVEAPVARQVETVEFHGVQVERSQVTVLTDVVAREVERQTLELTTQIVEKDARIKALEELPAGKVPAAVVREKFADMPDFSQMSREERLKAALTGVYQA